jgi:Trk K+ transport system NAD-binding subunit
VIVAVDHGAGDVVIPNGETVFSTGDGVIAMIKHAARADVCAALTGSAP